MGYKPFIKAKVGGLGPAAEKDRVLQGDKDVCKLSKRGCSSRGVSDDGKRVSVCMGNTKDFLYEYRKDPGGVGASGRLRTVYLNPGIVLGKKCIQRIGDCLSWLRRALGG